MRLTGSRSRFELRLAAMLTALFLLAACEPGEGYTIVNTSDAVVVLESNGVEFGTLGPGEETEVFMPDVEAYVVIQRWRVFDSSGALLREFSVTWDDVADGGFRVDVP